MQRPVFLLQCNMLNSLFIYKDTIHNIKHVVYSLNPIPYACNYQIAIHDCITPHCYFGPGALRPKPQLYSYITLQAFPRCLSVSI